jgi:ATP-dependent helicase HrpB
MAIVERLRLPIDDHLSTIREKLSRHPNLILKASPGTGKTTRVPPFLMKDPALAADRREIIVLEPRRLAAKFAAERVAQEEGVRVGEEVGYHFRFENRTGPKTQLRFYTEGMLLRRLLSDPELSRTSTVILDEFHERHLQSDIALSYLRSLQIHRKSPLRIVVMSATLDTDALANYLGNAPVIEVQAQLFPVEQLVRDAVRTSLASGSSGDLLVFLPGKSEIYRCIQSLEEFSAKADVLPLHGELSSDEQDRAIRRSDRTKIILATNIAETSLTLPGVRTVIDSGLHRVASYSHWSGVPRLQTRPISKASAIQRAGRAGRTAAGRCLRLYPKGSFDTRAAFDVPEIHRADLAQAILELKALGVSDLKTFPWFDPPPALSLESAERLLYRLGAIEKSGALTSLGSRLKESPAHPRLSRMLDEAAKRGVIEEASRLAALIQESEIGNSLESADAEEFIRTARLGDRARRSQNIFRDLFKEKKRSANVHTDLGISILCGFPDRVMKRKASSRDFLLSAGGSAEGPPLETLGQSEYFIALDVFEQQHAGQGKVRISSLYPLAPEWLFELDPPGIEEAREFSWDPARKRVMHRESMTYDQLVISETFQPAEGSKEALAVLIKTAWSMDLSKVSVESFLNAVKKNPDERAELESVLARIELGKKEFFSPPNLRRFIESALQGRTSLSELEHIDWNEALVSFMELEIPGFSHLLQKDFPVQFTFPNGRKVKIHYSLHQPPWLESRLQDFFGLKKGPSIGNGGKTPVILHLLAPNYRAVQVTTDLPGFWQKTYPELRKQLSRRYPRHAWPEVP